MGFRTAIGTAGFVALILISSVVGAVLGGGIERMLIVFLINLVAVLGIGIFSGNSGILSFGHLSFMAIAAYTSGILTMPLMMKKMTLPKLPGFLATAHFDFFTAAVITVLFVMVVAFVIGVIISRLEGSAATIATLALLVIIHGLIIGARDITRGSQSFFGVPRETDIIAAAIGAVIAVIVARLFRDSVPGVKLRASRDDSLAAGAMGVNVTRQRLLAWVISAGVVAIAGILIGHFLGAFSVKKFYFVDTFMLLAMLIVGGMATVSGALAGTILITVVTESLRHLEGGVTILGVSLPPMFGMTQIGIGLIILLVMYRKSGGLLDRREWDERVIPERIPADLYQASVQQTVSESNVTSPVSEPATVSVEGVSKSFNGLLAVDDVSLSLRAGEIVGLIGPNGSGKTTLLNVLSGVLPATSGKLILNGEDVTGKPSHTLAGYGVGRTFQNIRLFSTMTVRLNIMVSALKRWPRIKKKEAVALTNTAISAMGLNDHASVFASTLSYGDQRRVEIARALALQPQFLFLDEPAAGMNREETDSLMEDLRRLKESKNMGVLIIDHDLPLIMRLCDRVIVLNEGKLIAKGTPAEVQRQPAVVEAYLGRRARRARTDRSFTTGGGKLPSETNEKKEIGK